MTQKSIAVVGGGIAGLYCASKLAEGGHSVTLFEYLDRFGGRIETVDLLGFKAECGPMRFELGTQPLLKALGETLDIHFDSFSPPHGEPARFPQYQLQPNEKSTAQLHADQNEPGTEHSGLTSSLDLLGFGLYRILHPQSRDLPLGAIVEPQGSAPSELAKYAANLTEPDFARIRRESQLDGVFLYRLGFWNALARVLSPHAIAKIRDHGTFYHLMPENPSASEWMIFWLRLFHPEGGLSTIKAGVSTIVERLVDALASRPNLALHKNAKVQQIQPGTELNKVRLLVDLEVRANPKRISLDFDHVVLALPKAPLKELAEFFPYEIRTDIDAVIGFPLLKVFLVTDEPWWRTTPAPQHGAHLVPTREVHYFPLQHQGGRPLGMILLYTDRPATAYWQPYVQKIHESAQLNEPSDLKDELAMQVYKVLKDYKEAKAQTGASVAKTVPEDDSVSLQKALAEAFGVDESAIDVLGQIAGPIVGQLVSSHLRKSDIVSALVEALALTPFAVEILRKPEPEAVEELKSAVKAFAIRDWSRAPFGAACHAWAPGTIVPDALDRLQAFSLLGRAGTNNVHVCGEAYSDYQGFIEGALRSANNVLATI